MTVTTAQIRDLLNRPRGLNEGTITELITVRTNEVNKVARSSTLYSVGDHAVTTDLKEGAIKMLVCLDCLNILIDTIARVKEVCTTGGFNNKLKRFNAGLMKPLR